MFNLHQQRSASLLTNYDAANMNFYINICYCSSQSDQTSDRNAEKLVVSPGQWRNSWHYQQLEVPTLRNANKTFLYAGKLLNEDEIWSVCRL